MTGESDRGGTEPCFAHQLVDGHPVDPETARDVARPRRGVAWPPAGCRPRSGDARRPG